MEPTKMNIQEARTAWAADSARFETMGAYLPEVKAYIPDEWKRDYTLAMDAMPSLMTTPNSGVPAMLTTMIDPAVFKILFAPNRAAVILGENRKGTWLDETIMFPTVEHTGEVSSYGDYAENGHTGVNSNWPQRQSYLFQTVKEYGERELERAGLAKINWVSEIDQAAATVLNKFSNLTYFFGVAGMQNYGLFNDPNLPASITPATKAYGRTQWIYSNAIQATANEIYSDIQSLFYQLTTQTAGLVEADTKMVLAMSPGAAVALTATNAFNVNVYDLLTKNFPNIRFETAVQYGALSASNTQGIAGGNLVQLIAESIEGQDTGYAAFNEKMRSHPIVRGMSSFKQKITAGTWGAIIRMPIAFASLLGV
jgi:hypothetical protein